MSFKEMLFSFLRTRGEKLVNSTKSQRVKLAESGPLLPEPLIPSVDSALSSNPSLNQSSGLGYDSQGKPRRRPPVPLPPSFYGSSPEPQSTSTGIPVTYDPYRTSPLWEEPANLEFPDMSSYRPAEAPASFNGEDEGAVAWAMIQHLKRSASQDQ